MTRRFRYAAAGTTISALFAGGVGAHVAASGSAVDAPDPIEHVIGTDDPSTKQAILDAQTARQDHYITQVGACLETNGFAGAQSALANAPKPPPLPVVSASEEKAKYGYSITTNVTASTASDPLGSFTASIPEQRREELRATLADCTEAAQMSVYRRLQKTSDAYDAAESEMYAHLAADPAVKAAAAAWTTCMGGRWDNPPEVSDYLRAKAGALDANDATGRKALNQEEMALAQKDIRCQQEFVDPVYGPKLHDAKAEFVKKNADLLSALRDAMLER